ncbi:MAG TPA: heparinase II/III family protein, partial [Gemmatimonadaceae bacterium]|nr:heparinase II/III family protein [Gemmatimonadaceae bacterium]
MIGRLKGRSATELKDRLLQFAWATAERRGVMPSIRVAQGMSLRPRTPWPVIDRESVLARLDSDAVSKLLASADRIADGSFDVLGLSGVSYGVPVNWQRDPLAGREAAMVHWSRVPYLDHAIVGDHKITWEVNRHQWLITLGQAWILTGRAEYASTADRLLRAWLDANPPKLGINWCSALELAFRVQSWIHGLRLLDGAPELSAGTRRAVVESAALQVDHVVRNLSTWFSPNTHLTGEALAMLSAGCAWPDLPAAAAWREHGWRILVRELPKQVRADGVYFEQSAWYQAYTVDFYLLGMQWASLAGLAIPPDMPDTVSRAASALQAVTRPDGTIARLGDDDGGRTLPYVPLQFGDMTDTLWRAATHLDDATLVPPTADGRSALLWLEGANRFDAATELVAARGARASRCLPDGGWVTLAESGTTT